MARMLDKYPTPTQRCCCLGWLKGHELVSSPRKTFHPYGEEEGSGVNIIHLTSINIVNRTMPSVSTGEYALSFAHEHWIGIGVLNGPNCRLFHSSDSVTGQRIDKTEVNGAAVHFE